MADKISAELNTARKNLSDTLGDDMKIYLHLLKSWFRKKMTREDFDHEARGLLSVSKVHLHNQFLLAIMTKCQSLGASLLANEHSPVVHSTQPAHYRQPKKFKSKEKPVIGPTGLYQRFLPVDALCQAPQIPSHCPEQDDRVPEFAVHELLLPDIGMVHGRLVVTAWEFGLEGVQDDAVRMLTQSVETMIKTVLTVAVMRRKTYQLRNGCFRHSFGSHIPDLKLRNASLCDDTADLRHPTTLSAEGNQVPNIGPSVEVARRDAAVRVACAPVDVNDSSRIEPINLFDLLDALQVHKSAIPSHTVYTLNVERILDRINHPSREELEREEISQQETAVKRKLSEQRLLSCVATLS